MLPLFQNSSTLTQQFQDNIWLLWQVAWLYQDERHFPPQLMQGLAHYLNQQSTSSAQVREFRTQWMLAYGLPHETNPKVLLAAPPSAASALHKILANTTPEHAHPLEHIEAYLRAYAGLPEEHWERVKGWLLEDEKSAPTASLTKRRLESVKSFKWLTAEEITQVLANDPSGTQLLAMSSFKLIPLPACLTRPASLMLDDGSLWLTWPATSQSTALHPVTQASLICHEAAHLLANAQSVDRSKQGCEETLWESEKEALHAEWTALERECAHLSERQRHGFKINWLFENYTLQKQKLRADWHAYLQICSPSNEQRIEHSTNEYISMPFLSAIYACHAEDIWTLQNPQV